MEMGIVVTAFYLFGMLGLVIFNESLEEPTQQATTLPRAARPKSRPRVNAAAGNGRTHKKAA
jgi:hypothetical protein